MQEFRFLDWEVYQDTKKIIKIVFALTRKFPAYFRYELGSQINRSVISILLNIAEGSGKYSQKDFVHFLNIATGSLYETVAGLDIARDNALISEEDFENARVKLLSIARQIGGFKKAILK